MLNPNTNMYEGRIYLAINTINNMKYVGQTQTTIDERWRKHKTDSKLKLIKMVFHDAIRKYGVESFNIVELEKIEHNEFKKFIEILNDKEKHYIKELNTIAPNGYNLTAGGFNTPDQLKRPVNQYSLTGELINQYESIRSASYLTGIARDSISKCCKGISSIGNGFIWKYDGDEFNINLTKDAKTALKTKEKIKKYDYRGKLIEIYDNLHSISNNPEIRTHIRDCCNGKMLSAHGFIYRYISDEFESHKLPKYSASPIKISQYDLNDNLLQSFNSIKEAERITKFNAASISRCVHGKIKQHKGFIWKKDSE